MDIRIPEQAKKLTGFHLKMVAIITMLIDHSAKGLLYNCVLRTPRVMALGEMRPFVAKLYTVLRGIGRPAFPIFCFLLVEGFIHTRDRMRYLLRLIAFAIITEAVFDLCLYRRWFFPGHQNVLFEFALGIVMLSVWEFIGDIERLGPTVRVILQGCSAAAFLVLAGKFELDYGFKGLALILLLYLLRSFREEQCFAGAIFVSLWEWPAIFAFVLLLFYNGQRGRSMKYFFYAFYPAHLALIAAISAVLNNGL